MKSLGKIRKKGNYQKLRSRKVCMELSTHIVESASTYFSLYHFSFNSFDFDSWYSEKSETYDIKFCDKINN